MAGSAGRDGMAAGAGADDFGRRSGARLDSIGAARLGCAMAASMIPHDHAPAFLAAHGRSEEHTSELHSLMRNSYAVLCWKKKNTPAITKDIVVSITNITPTTYT